MARRKSEVEEVYENALEALAAGTEFKVGSEVKVLTTRQKVRTPVEILNCLLGGGIPFGTVLQAYGPPKSSKSTWLYQMMGIFQQEYPEGIAVVVDTEASGDTERLSFLGVDTSRILRLPATSIETGFLSLLKMLDNKSKNEQLKDTPVFVIWDSISKGLAQENSTQSRMNAQDRARIIKNYMSPMMAEIEKHNFVLCLINQAIYSTDRYGNRKLDAGGGVALKHDVHLSVKLELSSDYTEGSFLITRTSKMAIDKSKISPEIWDIPVVLDIREGGKIDEVLSLIEYFLWNGWITQTSGWYTFDNIAEMNKDNPFYPILASYSKKRRYNDMVQLVRDTPELYLTLKYTFIKHLASIYKLQAKVMYEYQDKITSELLNYLQPYSIIYDPSNPNNKLDELKDKLDSNPELKSRLLEAKGYEFISLTDASISDRLQADNLGIPSYVSNKMMSDIINHLYNNNEDEVVEVSDEQSIQQDTDN